MSEARDPALFFRDVALPNFMENAQQLVHPIRTMMAEEAAKAGKTVLDVACNTCIDYPFMRSKGLIYTGIDFQEKFIKRAKELYPEVDARVADATAIPFVSRTYATAYAKDLFEHLPPLGKEPNYQTAIREIWRVADRLMMLAFFHEPIKGVDAETNVSYHAAGFWDNTYSRTEINSCLVALDGVDHIEYREKIGSNYLYLVKKKQEVCDGLLQLQPSLALDRRFEFVWVINQMKKVGVTLDVGCNGSIFDKYLMNKGFSVVAADIDPNAKHYWNGELRTNFAQVDCRYPPKDWYDHFDFITIISTLEHIEGDDDILMVVNLAKCLSIGGKMFITVPYGDGWMKIGNNVERGYNEKNITRLLAPSKLHLISIEVFTKEQIKWEWKDIFCIEFER